MRNCDLAINRADPRACLYHTSELNRGAWALGSGHADESFLLVLSQRFEAEEALDNGFDGVVLT